MYLLLHSKTVIDYSQNRKGPGGPGGSPRRTRRFIGGNFPYRDMHYKIYHDEGADEITVDFEHAEPAGITSEDIIFIRNGKSRAFQSVIGRIVIATQSGW
jgi:hypothetical protein